MPRYVRGPTGAQPDFNHIEADADSRLSKLATPLEKEKQINSPTELRRKEGPFVPHNVWRSTSAQRDFNHIKADADVFRKRILR